MREREDQRYIKTKETGIYLEFTVYVRLVFITEITGFVSADKCVRNKALILLTPVSFVLKKCSLFIPNQ